MAKRDPIAERAERIAQAEQALLDGVNAGLPTDEIKALKQAVGHAQRGHRQGKSESRAQRTSRFL